MLRNRWLARFIPGVLAIGITVALPAIAAAQDVMPPREGVMGKRPESITLGGHAGFVVPVVRRANDVTTNVSDRFIYGFPVGLTVRGRGPVAVDFEFIPTFNTGDDFVLTIHPGVIHGFAKHYAIGVRAAYDAGSSNDSYGVTPLISRGFALTKKVGWFAELDLPIRRNDPARGSSFTSIALAGHIGLSF